MDYKIIELDFEEKLVNIAKKHQTSTAEIKKANPDVRFFKSLLDTEYVAAKQSLKIPVKETIEVNPSTGNGKPNVLFRPRARYRCNQNNVILIDGKPNFNCEIKTQYLYATLDENDKKLEKVKLEDYVTSIQPPQMEPAFNFIKEVEYLRNNVVFQTDENAKVKVLNMADLAKRWNHFKSVTAPKLEYYNVLKQHQPEVMEDFIQTGNKEFSDEKQFFEIIDKNLFYHILFRSYNKETEKYSIQQKSQIFPEILLSIDFVKSVAKKEEDTTSYRLVGTLNRENINDNKLTEMYNKLYRPLIKFSYSEFEFIFRIQFTVHNETGLLKDAFVAIKESVKNNYEITTRFDLKQVEL